MEEIEEGFCRGFRSGISGFSTPVPVHHCSQIQGLPVKWTTDDYEEGLPLIYRIHCLLRSVNVTENTTIDSVDERMKEETV